jgi:tape measure domain-containing protein
MSNVDERIVSMKFDNSEFEAGATKAIDILDKLKDTLKFDGAESGVENLKKSLSGFDTSGVSSSLDAVKGGFSALEQVGIGALRRIGDEVMGLGIKLVKNLANNLTKGARDGFGEYQTQMKSIQTISANSGEEMSVIKDNLNELNEYADKTIYSFSEMTANIGRFTAAGLDVKTSTNAIKGFSNMAALAGAGSQETARGMYQLSQAMATGVVKLQDWRSIQNASIDTAAFKDILIETARAMDMPVDKAIKKQGSFNASLTEGWLTADVMGQALQVATMSTRDFADEEEGMAQRMKELTKMGYSEDVAKKLIGIANAADDSAREVRTFQQLMETVEEAIGSGWAKTWELIVGDFDQATELFTTLSKTFDGIISASANARNAFFKDWADKGGRDALIGAFANVFEGLTRIFVPLHDAFSEVFSFSGEQLAVLTENFALFTQHLVIGEDVMTKLHDTFQSVFVIAHSIFGIIGNGVRLAIGYIGLFLNGFFGVKSTLLSVNDLLSPVAEWFNKIHVATDEAVNSFSDMAYKVTHFKDLWNEFKSGKSNLTRGDLFGIQTSGLFDLISAGENVRKIFENVVGVVGSFARILFSAAKAIWTFSEPLHDLIKIVSVFFVSKVIPKLIELETGLTTIIRRIVDSVSRNVSGLLDTVGSIFSEAYSTVSDFISALVDVLSENRLFRAFSDMLSGLFDSFMRFSSGNGAISFFDGLIDKFILTPLKSLAETLSNFNKDHGFDFFRDKIKSVADVVGGPFNIAFSSAQWLLEKVSGLLTGPVASAFRSAGDWLSGLVSFDSVKSSIGSAFSSGFKNPFANFELPASISDKLEELKTKFFDLGSATEGATWNVKTFIKQCGTKIKTSGKNRLDSIVSTLSKNFSALKEYFKSLGSNGDNLGQNIQKVFGDAYNALSTWVHNIASTASGFGGTIAQAFSFVLDQLQKVPSMVSSLFGNASQAASEGAKNLTNTAEEFKNNQKNFWGGIFDSLSSVDIGGTLSTFFGNVKEKIVTGFSNLLSSETGFDKGSLKSSLVGMFDFSDFKIVLPDFTTPIGDMVDGFSKILDKFPGDKIDGIITKISGWATTLGKLGFAFSGWKFLNSLTAFNKGLASEGKGLGELFSKLPEAVKGGMEGFAGSFGKTAAGSLKDGMVEISKAIKEFGKSFSPFTKKQAMSKSFRQVAEGLLILAAALFVLSKVPADDLERAGEALLKLMALSAGLTFLAAWFSSMAKLDLTGVGAAMAGLGVGMLGMAGAIYLFTKMSADPNIVVGMNNFKLVLELLVGAMAVLLAFSSLGNLSGVAATMLALTATIGLSLGTIVLLGVMPGKWFIVGTSRLKDLGLFFVEAAAFLSLVNGLSQASGGSMIAAVAAIAGLVATITLSIVPIVALWAIPEDVANTGYERLKWMMFFYSLVEGFLSLLVQNGKGALLASLAMIPMVAAITLSALPIYVLGKIKEKDVQQGFDTVKNISFLFGVLVTFFSAISVNLLAIAGAAIGLTLLMVPIAMMSAVVAALSFVAHKDLGAIEAAVHTLEGIVLAIVGMALTGMYGAGGLALLAVGITLVSGALMFLASTIDAIDFKKFEDGMITFGRSFGEAGANAITGFIGGIASGLGSILQRGIEVAQTFLSGLTGPNGLISHSPSEATEEIGEFSIEGFINGVANKLGEMLGMGEDSGQEFLSGLSDLPNKLGAKASEAVNTFIDNIDTDKIKDKGTNITLGIIEGIKGAAWQSLTAIPGQIFDAIAGGVKSFFGIESPSTVMATIGNNILQGLINGITDGTLLSALGAGALNLGNVVINGLGSFVGGVVDTGGKALGGFIGKIASYFGIAEETGAQVGNSAVSGMDTLASNAATKGVNGVLALAKGLSSGTQNVNKSASNLNTTAIKAVEVMGKNMTKVANNATKGMVNSLRAAVGQTRSAGAALASAAKSGASGHSLYNTGSNLASGFARGISGGAYKAINAAANMAAAAIRAARNKAEVKSPSRVFMRIGNYVSEGFAIGIRQGTGEAAKAGADLAGSIPDAFENVLDNLSIDIEDILDTDYSPEITPVINATSFNSGIGRLRTALGTSFNDLSIGNLNYAGELSARLSDANELNQQMVDAMSNNAIDYNLLGASVANALIQSGVHVEIDGGQLMGYLAGEVASARRMYQ